MDGYNPRTSNQTLVIDSLNDREFALVYALASFL